MRGPRSQWRVAASVFSGGVALWLVISAEWASSLPTAPQLSIAVARFSGGGQPMGSEAAEVLAEQLSALPEISVLTPSQMAEPLGAESEARVVRRVAFASGLDAIVVGRVAAGSPVASSQGASGRTLEVVVRSGHSGAVVSRHRAELSGRGELEAAAERLAASIARDLGWVPPGPELPAVASGAADAREGRRRAPLFAFGRIDAAQAIEIESEELDFVSLEDESRHIVFRRNVRVVQGEVTLLTDELEAFYPARQSEPEKLVARGSVRVTEGNRSAHCERATYLRSEQTLVCSGRAELVSGCDIVRGRSIAFDLDRDRAKVSGAASVLIRPRGERDCTGEAR